MKQATKQRRIEALDVGRGASVPVMILVHALWMYGTEETQTSLLGRIVHVLGRGTPMFLLAMGFSLALSRVRGTTALLKRGALLLATGYTMNALKFLVPLYVFRSMPENFIEAYGFHAPLTWRQVAFLFGTGDILQLAGISLLLIALVRPILEKPGAPFVLALGAAGASGVGGGWKCGVAGLDYLGALLWGRDFSVYFPVLPWISVILFGLHFGRSYATAPGDAKQRECRVFRNLFVFGLGAFALGGALCVIQPEVHLRDFFHLGPGGALLMAGISALLFWGARQIAPHLPRTLRAFLEHSSRRVTSLYVLQWVLICWGMGFVGYKRLTAEGVLLAAGAILAATLVSEWLLRHGLNHSAHVNPTSSPSLQAFSRSSSVSYPSKPPA